MRRAMILALSGVLGACGLFASDEEPKPEKTVARDPNPPAFVARQSGACPAEYTPRGNVCVHIRAPKELGDEALQRALLDYERGAAPPRLGPVGTAPVQVETVESAKDPTKLSPDALSTGQTIDAKAAEQKRLRDLQNRIDAARLRSGQSAQAATPPSPAPAPDIDGVKVEVEVDGKKRTMSASEWVKSQQGKN